MKVPGKVNHETRDVITDLLIIIENVYLFISRKVIDDFVNTAVQKAACVMKMTFTVSKEIS